MKFIEQFLYFLIELRMFFMCSIWLFPVMKHQSFEITLAICATYPVYYTLIRYLGLKLLQYDRLFGIKPYRKDDDWS